MLMKTITQAEIAKILNRSQSFVSKRLSNNSLRACEIKLLSDTLEVPVAAFIQEEEQIKYLGKSFINSTENDTKQPSSESSAAEDKKAS